jgi:hypothetical protein
MLGENQADEHHATLTAVHETDAVLDSDAGELRSRGLAGKYGIDASRSFFFLYFNWHMASF